MVVAALVVVALVFVALVVVAPVVVALVVVALVVVALVVEDTGSGATVVDTLLTSDDVTGIPVSEIAVPGFVVDVAAPVLVVVGVLMVVAEEVESSEVSSSKTSISGKGEAVLSSLLTDTSSFVCIVASCVKMSVRVFSVTRHSRSDVVL